MSRIALLALLVPGLFLSGCSKATRSAPERPFGLTPPVRLASVAYYLDGGTTGFLLVGAAAESLRGGIEGQMQIVGRARQVHCFVGASYPTDAGARLLTLWGTEERTLVQLLKGVLLSTLSPERYQLLLTIASALDLPPDVSVDMWQVVRAVDARSQTLAAIDRGLLASPDRALAYFDLESPVHIESAVLAQSSTRFKVTVVDEVFGACLLGFPASQDSVMAPSGMYGAHPERELRIAAGQPEDRLIVTLLSIALDGTEPGSAVDDLRALVRARIEKILEEDANG